MSEENSDTAPENVKDDTLIGRVYEGDWAALKKDFEHIAANKIYDKVQKYKEEFKNGKFVAKTNS